MQQEKLMRKQGLMRAFEDDNMEDLLEALKKSIARWTENGEQHVTAIPGLSLYRRDAPKRVLLGDDTYLHYGNHCLITSAHLPTIVQIIEARRKNPTLDSRGF